MLGIISSHVRHKVVVHEDIPSCAADEALPTYKNEGCRDDGYRPSS